MFTLLYLLAIVWFAIVTESGFDESLFAVTIATVCADLLLFRWL